PGLVLEWSDDGKSLAVRWEEQDATGEATSQLRWVRPDGTLGLEATLATGLTDTDPTWVPAPDGKRMGLAAGGGAWAWTEGEARAVALPELGGVWGFDPAGQLVAS